MRASSKLYLALVVAVTFGLAFMGLRNGNLIGAMLALLAGGLAMYRILRRVRGDDGPI